MDIFTISDDLAEHLGSLFHCLTPSLTSVTIRNIEGERGAMLATSFISALSRESTGLRDLSIDGRISKEAIDCLENIDHLRSLKVFVNSPVVQANVEKLMGLLDVPDLTIEFGKNGTVTMDIEGVHDPLKVFIETLRILGTSEQIEQVFDILPLSSCRLEDITVEILDPPPTINPAPWRSMPKSLTALTIEAHVGEGNFPVISLNDLQLPDSLWLENLSLRATHDGFLRIFESGQLKTLRYLCLQSDGDIDPPCPSVEILAKISRWCPELRNLVIYVDLRLSDEKSLQNALRSMKTSTHGLSELYMQSITPPKPNGFHQGVLLAQYIDALFPELHQLLVYDDSDENQTDYWAGIWEAVKWSQAKGNDQSEPLVCRRSVIDLLYDSDSEDE